MTGFLTNLGASLFSGAWKLGLRHGSFRGVPFLCRDSARTLGQRVATFEFPDSDTVYSQLLGRGAKHYRLDIFVVGDGYMLRRDALEAAMDLRAPGTLVHPYRGELQVMCKYPSRLREMSEKGRAAFYEAEFVEIGAPQQPLPDTVATVLQMITIAKAILAEAYSILYDGQNAAVQLAFSVGLGAVQSAIGSNLTAPAGSLQMLQDLATMAGIAPDNAPGYAAQLGTLLGNYTGNIVDGFTPAADTSLAPGFQDLTRLPDLPGDPSYGLGALAAANFTPASATGTIATNGQALTQLVNGQSTLALANLYAQTDFASSADAEAARTQISGLIDDQIAAAQTMTSGPNDPLVQAWRGVQAASVADLTARAAAAPDLATVSTPAPMPALAMAQQIYQDGTQAPGLVQRNGAPHPLFLPQSVEYLQA